jgi:transposase
MDVERRTRERAARAGPVLNSFFAWVDDEQLQVLPESPIGKAVTYARNQRVALARFLDDGRLPRCTMSFLRGPMTRSEIRAARGE